MTSHTISLLGFMGDRTSVLVIGDRLFTVLVTFSDIGVTVFAVKTAVVFLPNNVIWSTSGTCNNLITLWVVIPAVVSFNLGYFWRLAFIWLFFIHRFLG
ncbi:hypothetical protein [Nostoc sp. T09]|uniref:hypothetical protein n=1 Tax=Nostoc sp. T09 TaxID=1932621 RepID=UPI001C4E4C81|nr:hypothetical protein [Nostoc sp. T09]